MQKNFGNLYVQNFGLEENLKWKQIWVSNKNSFCGKAIIHPTRKNATVQEIPCDSFCVFGPYIYETSPHQKVVRDEDLGKPLTKEELVDWANQSKTNCKRKETPH